MNIDVNSFHTKGYLIVKDVFSEDQISNFRKLALESEQIDSKNNLILHSITKNKNVRYSEGDLIGKPLKELLLSDEILHIAKTLLDATPIYFGDSTYQIGTGDRGFHRDNIDRILNQGDDWDGSYDLIRMGVYLQDHHKYSGGLKVIEGSHVGYSNKRVFVNSKAGDVVCWNMRILHSGNAARLKFLPGLVLGSRLENILPDFLFKGSQLNRISCFMTFGKRGKNYDDFVKKYMQVKMIKHIDKSNYSSVELDVQNKNIIFEKISI